MTKHTETIRRLLPISCLSVFVHLVGLSRKGLKIYETSFLLLLTKLELYRFEFRIILSLENGMNVTC